MNYAYSNNPATNYNGMMSGMRNMILSSSVAIVMIGYISAKMNNNKIFQIFAVCILFLSAYIGIGSALDFDYYLKNNNFQISIYNVAHWKMWKYISITYAIFLIILGFASLFLLK